MTRKPSDQAPVGHLEGHEPRESGTSSMAWRVAACGVAIEAFALVALAAASAFGVISGGASTATRAITEAVMLLILAIGLVLLARALFQRKSLAKTPTLVWNFMLLPVGYSLATAGAPTWGIATIVLALLTFAAAVLVPRYDLDDPTDTL